MSDFKIQAGELKDLLGGDGKVRPIPSEENKEAAIDPKYKDMPGDQVIVPEGRPAGLVVEEVPESAGYFTSPIQCISEMRNLYEEMRESNADQATCQQIGQHLTAIKNLLG